MKKLVVICIGVGLFALMIVQSALTDCGSHLCMIITDNSQFEAIEISKNGTGNGIYIDNEGSGDALNILNENAGVACFVIQEASNYGLYVGQHGNFDGIYVDKSGNGTGKHAITARCSGSGSCIYAWKEIDNNTDPAIYALNESTDSAGFAGKFVRYGGYANSITLWAQNDGAGTAIRGYTGPNNGKGVWGENHGAGVGVYGAASNAAIGVLGYSAGENSYAGKFYNLSTGTKPCLTTVSYSNAYALSVSNEKTGSVNAPAARFSISNSDNTGNVLRVITEGTGSAVVCSTKGLTGDCFAAVNPGGNGYCYRAAVGTANNLHVGKLASFSITDMNNIAEEPFIITNLGEGHAAMIKRTHPGGYMVCLSIVHLMSGNTGMGQLFWSIE